MISSPDASVLPADPGLLALDRQLCFALYSSSLAMTRLYTPLLKPLGLTYPQYLVLLDLWEHGEATVSELGTRLFLDSGTLTPLLKRLQMGGLVTRSRDPEDERRVRVSLTAAGLALRAPALAIPEALACATACEFDEISRLTQQLKALRGRLHQAHT
jgi:DNA-binding MarR family transcriptional regulator